ncbi:MAG: trehalose-phosphatase [Actinomycetota bacterium]
MSKIEALIEDRSQAGLFLDFDGTLSEIAHRPADARPVEDAPEALAELANHFGLVAIVSGRSAHQLVDWLGTEIEIWGVHGAERTVDGSVVLSDAARPFEELMRVVHTEALERVAALDDSGVVVEDKAVMIGLHFRAAENVERARDQLDRIATDLADRHGLHRAGGRLAFELRPPHEFSKAAVVLDRTREQGLTAAAFVGDDRVDLPGFDALDVLGEKNGIATLKVAVRSDEAPPELLERADVVVNGPAEVVRFLRSLLP